MQVMHTNHSAILTIVQVLLYDPLYVWTISPIRAYQLQHRHAADVDAATDANMNTTSVDLLDQSITRPKRQFFSFDVFSFVCSCWLTHYSRLERLTCVVAHVAKHLTTCVVTTCRKQCRICQQSGWARSSTTQTEIVGSRGGSSVEYSRPSQPSASGSQGCEQSLQTVSGLAGVYLECSELQSTSLLITFLLDWC